MLNTRIYTSMLVVLALNIMTTPSRAENNIYEYDVNIAVDGRQRILWSKELAYSGPEAQAQEQHLRKLGNDECKNLNLELKETPKFEEINHDIPDHPLSTQWHFEKAMTREERASLSNQSLVWGITGLAGLYTYLSASEDSSGIGEQVVSEVVAFSASAMTGYKLLRAFSGVRKLSREEAARDPESREVKSGYRVFGTRDRLVPHLNLTQISCRGTLNPILIQWLLQFSATQPPTGLGENITSDLARIHLYHQKLTDYLNYLSQSENLLQFQRRVSHIVPMILTFYDQSGDPQWEVIATEKIHALSLEKIIQYLYSSPLDIRSKKEFLKPIIFDLQGKNFLPSGEKFKKIYFRELKKLRIAQFKEDLGPLYTGNGFSQEHWKAEPNTLCIGCTEIKKDGVFRCGARNPNCKGLLCKECSQKMLQISRTEKIKVPHCAFCSHAFDPDFFKVTDGDPDLLSELEEIMIRLKITSDKKNWSFCHTEECLNGKCFDSQEPKQFQCEVCDFEGCLECGKSHPQGFQPDGRCMESYQNQEFFKILAKQGKRRPLFNTELTRLQELSEKAPNGAPCPICKETLGDQHRILDHKYDGLYRPCPHCGMMTEKIPYFAGGACNHLICQNPDCKKDWSFESGEESPLAPLQSSNAMGYELKEGVQPWWPGFGRK
jgi:hypothetical protein